MSRNAVFLFSVWTSLLSAVFYFLYGFTAFGVPWVMFVCLAIFFGMGGHVRDVPAMCLSALAGCVWLPSARPPGRWPPVPGSCWGSAWRPG